MSQTARILTITLNPALDMSTATDHVLPDRKLRCEDPRAQPGGGGVNVSRAIGKLGGQSRALVAVGGGTGRTLVSGLKAEGLDPIPLGVQHPTRQSLSIVDRANGAQYRFVMPGPSWNRQDADTALAAIAAHVQPGDLVVPSGSSPPGVRPGFWTDLAAMLPRGGDARMVLDTSGASLAHAARKGGFYALRMDRLEACELAGRELTEIREIAEFAQDLRERGAAEVVLVAAGAQGTILVAPGVQVLTRPPVVRVRSKVGAGDSFVAAFTLALARGADPMAACVAGTGAAASAVTTPDTDLCDRETAERYADAVEVSDV